MYIRTTVKFGLLALREEHRLRVGSEASTALRIKQYGLMSYALCSFVYSYVPPSSCLSNDAEGTRLN
jgi:hypothetical protein